MQERGHVIFVLFFNVLILVVLGLRFTGFSLVMASRCYSLVVMHELLIAVALLVAEHPL